MRIFEYSVGRTLPTARGGVRLTYFRNLQWHDGALTEADKPQDAAPVPKN